MDASEFKKFIFGMLLLKRLSDEFDYKREQLRNRELANLKDQPELVQEMLEDRASYGDTFFVPVRARWHESWRDDSGELVPARPRFWNIVRAQSPTMEKARTWLKENGQLLEQEL